MDYEEDIEFEKLLADRTHRELMSAIKQLVTAIKRDEAKDGELLRSINSNNGVINLFLNKVSDLIRKDPEINVEINQDKVVEELRRLATELAGKLRELKKPTEWEFTVHRGYQNRIESVTAKAKSK